MQSAPELIFDERMLDDVDEYGVEERRELDTGDANLRAELVFRDGDLEFVELTWFKDPALPFPSSQETVADVLRRAARLGYSIAPTMRRGVALDEGRRYVERIVVYFHPEPSGGDGTGVSIRIDAGLALDDDDLGNPKEVAALRDRWAARIEELLRQRYPAARLDIRRIDDDAEDVVVTSPVGIDPTDFEWVVEDLVEQARDEVLGAFA
jgi:hypothetical protein